MIDLENFPFTEILEKSSREPMSRMVILKEILTEMYHLGSLSGNNLWEDLQRIIKIFQTAGELKGCVLTECKFPYCWEVTFRIDGKENWITKITRIKKDIIFTWWIK